MSWIRRDATLSPHSTRSQQNPKAPTTAHDTRTRNPRGPQRTARLSWSRLTLQRPMCETRPSSCARFAPCSETWSGVAFSLGWCSCHRKTGPAPPNAFQLRASSHVSGLDRQETRRQEQGERVRFQTGREHQGEAVLCVGSCMGLGGSDLSSSSSSLWLRIHRPVRPLIAVEGRESARAAVAV
eukprot:3342015-Rhodomonas_salina.1